MRRSGLALAILAASLLGACGGSHATAPATGGAGGSAGSGGSGGDGGTGGTAPGGTSCADALPLTLGVPGKGQIDRAGRRVYFSVDVHGGDLLQVFTVANPEDNPDGLDTVLTLWDAAGETRLASVDDSFPRESPDSSFEYRADVDRTLCVMVEDYSSWGSDTPVAKPGSFRVVVSKVSPARSVTTIDAEPNDSDATAETARMIVGEGLGSGSLCGGLDSAGDVDVYRFTATGSANDLAVYLPPLPAPAESGVQGVGSTLPAIAVSVEDTTGRVVGAFDPGAGGLDSPPDHLLVPVTPGADYLLRFAHPQGVTAGTNDFYSAAVSFAGGDSPERETSAGQNDSQATAEQLPMGGRRFRIGAIYGNITPAGDVDVFRFVGNANDSLTLSCAAQRSGSGLRGATFTIASPTTELGSETETAARNVSWSTAAGATKPPLTLPAGGNYFLQISAQSQDASNPATYYRCVLQLVSQ